MQMQYLFFLICLWMILYHPDWALLVFLTMTIGAINFDITDGIRFRPVLAICLFIRSFFDNRFRPDQFLYGISYQLLIIYFIYMIMLSWGWGTIHSGILRLLLLSLMTAYLAFYAYKLFDSHQLLEYAVLIAGIICLADLVYTYAVIGYFPVQRIYYTLFKNAEMLEEANDTNHNFYGFICGISFVLLFFRFIHQKTRRNEFYLLLLPIYFIGVLMSTSRSTLLGIIVASVFILYKGFKFKDTRKRAFATISKFLVIITLAITVFISLQSYFDLDQYFVTTISKRLIDEPAAVIKKHLGFHYDRQELDAMDWRTESAAIAMEAYSRLPVFDQLVGVGIGGYLHRDLGRNGLNPHNGVIYILVESGFIGIMFYLLLLTISFRIQLLRHRVSSMMLVMVFVIFYALGQNEELISPTAISFLSSMFADDKYF